MIHGSLRMWLVAAAAGWALLVGCGPTVAPRCQASNCSGCCAEDGGCLGVTKQSFNACGAGGAKCRTCLPDQDCTNLRCVAIAAGGGSGGVGGGGGSSGGAGGGSGGAGGGGGAACGASGQACCVGSGSGCLLGLFCVNAICGTGGSGGGGGAGGGGGGGGGGAGGGGAGGSGGGAALGGLGAPCVNNTGCSSAFCQAFGFPGGYCTKACTLQSDCPAGSECSRNPAGGGNVCLGDCATAGTAPGGCRAGYVCEKFQTSINNLPVCFPTCASAISCVGGPVTCDGRGFCCGSDGSACCNNASCDPGFTCDATTKYCKPISTTNRATGEACTTNTNCAGNICVNEVASMPPACTVRCYTGGYCTQDCIATACPAGSTCTLFTFILGAGSRRCAANCVWDGGQGDCRTDYVCDRYVVGIAGSTQPTCYKKCFAGGECLPGASCENGFCCGPKGFRCCAGATSCLGDGGCNALGYCQ